MASFEDIAYRVLAGKEKGVFIHKENGENIRLVLVKHEENGPWMFNREDGADAGTYHVMDLEHFVEGFDPDQIEPIPLTNSVIQKNFQPRYKDIYELTTLWGIRPFHDHWQVCLLTMDEFGGGSWEGAFEVRYVHEVQQFLRLLKVGKEVVL